nr:ribonuclease H-like domain-containing protein [Tanacetum cinerariifolium]
MAVPHQTTTILAQHAPVIVQNRSVNINLNSVHHMVTWFHVGTNRPTERLNLHVSLVSPLLKSYRDAFSDPNWQNAMGDEYHALIKNNTCTLVPKPPDTNFVRCSLRCLTFTRLDISYAVQQVSLHMHDPWEDHLSALKRILWYVQGTLHYGLQLFSSSTMDLVVYFIVDWAGCPTTRRSTSGYYVFLGNNVLSWSSKRQPTLSYSSADGEYRGVTNFVAKTCWLRNLLRELHTPLSSAAFIYYDNVSAVYLSYNPIQH